MSVLGYLTNFSYLVYLNLDYFPLTCLSLIYLTVPKAIPLKDAIKLILKTEQGAVNGL